MQKVISSKTNCVVLGLDGRAGEGGKMQRIAWLLPVLAACAVDVQQVEVPAEGGLRRGDNGSVSLDTNQVPVLPECAPGSLVRRTSTGWDCVALEGQLSAISETQALQADQLQELESLKARLESTQAELQTVKTALATMQDRSTPVVATYRVSPIQTLADNQVTLLVYGKKEEDNTGAVQVGANAWAFVAPRDGRYLVSVIFTTALASSPFDLQLRLYKNGSDYSRLAYHPKQSELAASLTGCQSIRLNARDSIDIRVWQAGGGALQLNQQDLYNTVSITRIGD